MRWMAPTVSWSSASSTMRARTRSYGPGAVPVLGPALGLIRQGRLVAVVPVGDDHRVPRPRRRRWRRWRRGRRAPRAGGARRRRRRRRRVGSSSVGSNVAVSPWRIDSPQMGERLARVARSRSSRSLLGLGSVCSWGRMSLSWPGLGQAEGADHPGRGTPGGVGHPVGVQAGRRVGDAGCRRPASG